jgi:hypothetical protein
MNTPVGTSTRLDVADVVKLQDHEVSLELAYPRALSISSLLDVARLFDSVDHDLGSP